MKILLHRCYVDRCLKFVEFLRDITKDYKNNDRIFFSLHKQKEKNRGKETKMNMIILFMTINLNLIYGTQENIIMWGENLIKIRYVIDI